MGKSDAIILPRYAQFLKGVEYEKAALLGFTNRATDKATVIVKELSSGQRSYFDLQFEQRHERDQKHPLTVPWDINSNADFEDTDYDFIISTRCPYFAQRPREFFDRCMHHLKPGGTLMLDWGLGHHWSRFNNFKVGWVRDGEHEWEYQPLNFLHSCLWNQEVASHPETLKFWDNVRGRFGYPADAELDDIVRAEVPQLVDYPYQKLDVIMLWPELPQLYIMTLTVKDG